MPYNGLNIYIGTLEFLALNSSYAEGAGKLAGLYMHEFAKRRFLLVRTRVLQENIKHNTNCH